MLFYDEVKDLEELVEKLKSMDIYLDNVKVGVVCFIFDEYNNLILNKRGANARDEVGKLQAFGGSVNKSDHSLRDSLKRELAEEVGTLAHIEIEKFIGAQLDKKVVNGEEINWIILAYTGKLIDGNLINMEADKSDGFVIKKPDEFLNDNLSTTAYNFIKLILNN